jgi:hypothetical protein
MSPQSSFATYINHSPRIGAKSLVAIHIVPFSIAFITTKYTLITILVLINHQNPIITTICPNAFTYDLDGSKYTDHDNLCHPRK